MVKCGRKKSVIRVAIVEGYECNAYGYILKENMIEKTSAGIGNNVRRSKDDFDHAQRRTN